MAPPPRPGGNRQRAVVSTGGRACVRRLRSWSSRRCRTRCTGPWMRRPSASTVALPAGTGDLDDWVVRAVIDSSSPLLREQALYHSSHAAIAAGATRRGER